MENGQAMRRACIFRPAIRPRGRPKATSLSSIDTSALMDVVMLTALNKFTPGSDS